MGNLKSMGSMRKKANVVSIGSMKISPAKKISFHRKEAVKSLRNKNYLGYRYHSMQVAKINTGLVLSRMKGKK